MKPQIKTARDASEGELTQAIAIWCSPVFPAMSIAHAVGGSPSATWKLISDYSLPELITAAEEAGIDLSTVDAAVEGGKITETKTYKKAKEL